MFLRQARSPGRRAPQQSPPRRHSRRLAGFAALLTVTGVFVPATPASSATSTARPDADVSNTWQVKPDGGAAYAALDDEVTSATSVPATDWLWAGSAGRTAEVAMSPVQLAGNVPEAGTAWFYANTGPATRLVVEVVWNTTVRASLTVPAGSGFAWRSIPALPPTQQAVDDLRLRFRSLDGGDTNVRAAYFSLDHRPSPVTVAVLGSAVKVRPGDPLTGASDRARLVAARNEVESFQVAVDAGSAAVSGFDVRLSGVLRSGANTIGADQVTIYRQRYYDVKPTPGPSDAEYPLGPVPQAVGLWPDALVPVRDAFHGELRNAFADATPPPAGQRQLAWVDIQVPATAAAGIYTGALSVSASGTTRTVPVELQVLDLAIPATSSLRSAWLLYAGRPCPALHGIDCDSTDPERGWATNAMFTKAALDNRVSVSSVFRSPVNATETARMDRYHLPFFTGAAFPAEAPHLAPRLPGARLTSIEANLPNSTNPTDVRNEPTLLAWRQWAERHGLTSRAFTYVCDEPNDSAAKWSTCRDFAALSRRLWPQAPTLVTATVKQATQAQALDQLDLLVVLANYLHDKPDGNPAYVGNQRPTYDGFTATPGNGAWLYTSCMSAGCSPTTETSPYWRGWAGHLIDAPATQSRATGWLAHSYRLSGELYYETAMKLGTAWTDQFNEGGHGDGTLFYPGTPDRIGGTTAVPVESLRLKLVRDGYEDYELLRLATQRGLGAQADAIARDLFPSTYDTTRTDADVQTARTRLINLLRTP